MACTVLAPCLLQVWPDRSRALGKYETARILTATFRTVNKTYPPVTGPATRIYKACGHFKQTFVLDLHSGVDIMPSFKRSREFNAGRIVYRQRL